MKLRDQAYQAFIQHLLDRRLRPGAFVTQRELVALTGFPLGAVREMIPRLESDGLVHAIPQRGLQVATVDLRLVREAFQLREMIETAAITQYTLTATDAAVAQQRASLDEVIERARAGVNEDLLAYAQRVDWSFHDSIVAHMGNTLVSDVHRVNVVRIRVIMQERAALSVEVLPPAFEEHASILDAIERRNAPGAVAALQAHLMSARHRALGFEVVADDNSRRMTLPRRNG